jgi:hypothetical protein
MLTRPSRPISVPQRRLAVATVWLLLLVLGGCRRRARAYRSVNLQPNHGTNQVVSRAPTAGLYWAKIADLTDGVRVRLWLQSDGHRVRGDYSAQPWDGELDGTVELDGSLSVRLYERGVTQSIGARDRTVVLRRERNGARYIGVDQHGAVTELLRAPMGEARFGAGVWMAHWTGLPAGMAAEVRVSLDPDGHYRGIYQYQSGGPRDGSFDGVLLENNTIQLDWTESNDGTTVARGRATLAPARFGYRGTYGIEGHDEGVGEWIFEPLVSAP